MEVSDEKNGFVPPEPFLSRVAWLYHVCGLTQSEVAKQLGTTRLKVNKTISYARREGMVQIDIASPFTGTHELAEQLKERYSLRDVYVSIVAPDSGDCHESVGTALAFYLNDLLAQQKVKSIGVAWGSTLECAVKTLKPSTSPELDVVSLMGGVSRGTSINSFGIAANFASKLNARYHLFAAPIYCESAALTKTLLKTDLLKEQIKKAVSVDIALLVAGDISKKSILMNQGLPRDITMADLKKAGAVGDVLGRFLDKDGVPIKHPINDRVISPSFESFQKFKHAALVAAGDHKTSIIHAALSAGFIHTLITDNETAERLLRLRG